MAMAAHRTIRIGHTIPAGGIALALVCLALACSLPARAQPFQWTPLPHLPPFPVQPLSPTLYAGTGFSCLNAVVFSGSSPNVASECSYWFPANTDAAYGPPPAPATASRAQKDSGSDWWYDHKSSHAAGKLNGYVAAGFSRFVQWAPSELAAGGCLLSQVPSPDCSKLDSSGTVDGGVVATLALINIDGSVAWTRAFEPGFFTRVIQTSDGGYLAIGKTYATLAPDGARLAYNPGQPDQCAAGGPSSTANGFSPGHGCPLTGSAGPHVLLVKTDAQGLVEWESLYGMQPYDSSDPRDAYEANAEGWDVIETARGNFILVGSAVDPSSTYLCAGGGQYPLQVSRGFAIEVDRNGLWRWGSFLTDFTRPSIVTAIARHSGAGVDHYVISGMYTSAGCHQRIFALQFAEPATSSPPCPALAVDWQNLVVEPADPDKDQNTFGVQVAANPSSGTTSILLPGVVSIANNSGNANVYSLSSSNGRNLIDQPPVPVAQATAFDLRLMILPTADGGFAAATTVAGDPTLTLTPSCAGILKTWNTDGFVAKYDAGYNQEWQIRFDTFGKPDTWPGDQRKQECLFAISSDGRDGFVVSGHNSFNFDDSYIAHITPHF